MHAIISKLFIAPFSALLSQVERSPDDMGIFALIVITLGLLIWVTLYFVRHKRTTTPAAPKGSEDGAQK